ISFTFLSSHCETRRPEMRALEWSPEPGGRRGPEEHGKAADVCLCSSPPRSGNTPEALHDTLLPLLCCKRCARRGEVRPWDTLARSWRASDACSASTWSDSVDSLVSVAHGKPTEGMAAWRARSRGQGREAYLFVTSRAMDRLSPTATAAMLI